MRLLCRLTAFLLLVVSGCFRFAAAQTSFQFVFTEPPGAHAVGFRVIEQYDRTRTFDNSGPRPLQTLVWYPAEHSPARPMTLGEYATLVKSETSFGKPVDHGKVQDFVAQFTRGLDALPMRAVRNASPQAAAHFPLVIYAPSYNSTNTENIELCEYLASYGYVVMARPSLGAGTREMTIDTAGANAQAGDIEFVLETAKSLPDANLSEVADIGYSWGGTAALVAAARDKRIHALVALDSSFLYGPVPVSDVHADQIAIPLLVFSRGEEPLAFRDSHSPDAHPTNVLNEWKQGDMLHSELLAASHITFSSLYQRSERFRSEGLKFAPADYSLQEGAESYNWMARYTREFLDAYLKNEASAAAFIRRTPAENGVPPHLMAADFQAAAHKTAASK